MKKKMVKIVLVVSIFYVFLFFFLYNNVQASYPKFMVEFSLLDIVPNTEVTAKFIGIGLDKDRTHISWYLNDILKSGGYGNKSFNFVTNKAGVKTELTVEATLPNGEIVKQEYSFPYAEVDILWEAETYTPYSYKGKAIPTTGAKIKAVAIPNFGDNVRYEPGELIYTWSVDHNRFSKGSGLGKDFFVFNCGTLTGKERVKVEIVSYDKEFRAVGFVEISSVEPEIIFYEDDSLEGAYYQRAIGREWDMLEDRVSIKAEPFFFSKEDLGVLPYKWKVDRKDVMLSRRADVIDFETKQDGVGVTNVALSIRNPNKRLQVANGDFYIRFGVEKE